MNTREVLPPGQREIDNFPRFGLTQYARRFRAQFDPLQLQVSGDVENTLVIDEAALASLPRTEQASDFHCVTTWSKRDLQWSGYRFLDFYRKIVLPQVQPHQDTKLVILRSQDGFRTSLPLADLLSEDVLLADRLGGKPLSSKHGAPLRLIAPAHYGFKNLKHVKAIEFWRDESKFRPPGIRFMDHPRARVAFEERGRGLPGWLLRLLYRPLIKPTIRLFERTMR